VLIVGLTGSIGMGKSTAAKRFIENGVPVFNADAEVHRLYEAEAVPLIEAAFPGTTVDGRVDRERLSAVLFEDKSRIAELEAIVHPLVRAWRQKFLEENARKGTEMVVLEIPLLFETGSDKDVDVTVVVSAPKEVQRRRVLERPNMNAARLDTLLANQTSDQEKRARADFVVDTSGPIEETGAKIDKLVESLRGRRGTAFDRLRAGN
jgi:dephospho-CoA kinase